MIRTATVRTPLAPAAAILSALALLVALTGPGLTPASADQFTPLEDPPSIVIDTTNIMIGDPKDGGSEATGAMTAEVGSSGSTPYSAIATEFQPADGGSTEIYNVFATITTNGQLSNVTEVRFCLYNADDTRYSTEDNIDTDCGIDDAQVSSDALPTAASTNSDPTRLLVINYTHSNTTAAVVGDNNHADAGTFYDVSNVTENDDDTRSATIRFSFTVSNAMDFGSNWKMRAAAESQATIDQTAQDEQSAVHAPATTFDVAYFGSMTTGRAGGSDTAVDYGVVTPGVTVLKTNETDPDNSISTGTYTANDASTITIEGTDFQTDDDSNTIALADNGDIWASNEDRSAGNSVGEMETAISNVPDGTISLDCAYDADVVTTLDNQTELQKFVQVRNTARAFLVGQTATAEDGTALTNHSCFVHYAGGGPLANVEYQNSVTLGVIQDEDENDTLGQ